MIDIKPAQGQDLQQAKDWILNSHYIRRWPKAVQAVLGVYDEGKLVGTLVYGIGTRGQATSEIFRNDDGSPVLANNQMWELQRAYTTEDAKKSIPNLGSMVISRGNNWIRQNAKTKDGKPIKAILSFADSAVGHKGSVYQSTNALYLGEQPPRPFHIVTNPATGKHSRVFSMKPTAMRKFKEMGYTIEKQLPESGKHKFLYVLGADQRERDQLEAKIKPQLYSYPKDDQPSKPIVNTAKQRVQSRPQQQTQPAAPQTKRDTIKKLLRTTIKNPETGHTILVQSALRYDKTSPVYRAAMGMVNAWSRKHGLKIKPTR